MTISFPLSKLAKIEKINPNLHAVLLRWPQKDDKGDPVMTMAEYTELMMANPAPQELDLPPLMTQLANAAGAVGRAVGAAVKGQPVFVTDAQMRERLIKCIPCEHCLMPSLRCNLCSCWTAGLTGKTRIATESCPLPEPRWSAIVAQEEPG